MASQSNVSSDPYADQLSPPPAPFVLAATRTKIASTPFALYLNPNLIKKGQPGLSEPYTLPDIGSNKAYDLAYEILEKERKTIQTQIHNIRGEIETLENQLKTVQGTNGQEIQREINKLKSLHGRLIVELGYSYPENHYLFHSGQGK